MRLRPLILSAKALNWRPPQQGYIDKQYASVRRLIFERDKYTCQFCGLVSDLEGKNQYKGRFLEGHHINDDHNDNRPENLVTACPWCHGCFHIGLKCKMNLGQLGIHPEHPHQELPDQNVLNYIVWSILYIKRNGVEEMLPIANELKFFLRRSVDAFNNLFEGRTGIHLAEYIINEHVEGGADPSKRLTKFRFIPWISEQEAKEDEVAFFEVNSKTGRPDHSKEIDHFWEKENIFREYFVSQKLSDKYGDFSNLKNMFGRL